MIENERQLAADTKDAAAEGQTAQKAKRSSGPINETLFQGSEASFGMNEGQSQMRPKRAIRRPNYLEYFVLQVRIDSSFEAVYSRYSKTEATRYPSGLLCDPKVKTDCLAKSTDVVAKDVPVSLTCSQK